MHSSNLLKIMTALCLAAVGQNTHLLSHGHGHHHHHDSHEDDHDHDHEHDHIIRLSPEQIAEANITIGQAKPGMLVQQIQAPGKITIPPQAIVQVAPKAPGTVVKIYKMIGEQVNANETIAVIKSREFADAKAKYVAAEKRTSLKNRILEKERLLQSHKLSAEKDVWAAEFAAEESQIEQDLAKQELFAYGLSEAEIQQLEHSPAESFSFYELRSPAEGTITAFNVVNGQYVTPENSLLEIADLSKYWIEIDIPSSYSSKTIRGSNATVVNTSGQTCPSNIICQHPLVVEHTRTMKAYAETSKSDKLPPPGSYVNVSIDSESKKMPLVIPKTAIQSVDGENVVFVVNAEGFEIRPVKLGESDDVRVAITDGLATGEKLAIRNTFLLKAEHEKDEAAHEH